MPFNGSGVFSRVYSWVTDAANGLNISSSRMDTDTNDIANGLTNCLCKDGQSTPTANLPMGGFKLTGLAAGASPTDSINFAQFTSPTFTGQVLAPDGAVGAPGYAFSGATDTGFYRVNATEVAITVGGVQTVLIDHGVYGYITMRGATGAGVGFQTIGGDFSEIYADTTGMHIAAYSSFGGFPYLTIEGTSGTAARFDTDLKSLTVEGFMKSSGPTGGVGYAAGAGGVVTQATNKSTGVTLDKVCGKITMNGAALLANTTVSFTLTNSAIAATDVIVVHVSGGTATTGTYQVWADTPASGSVKICVRNISAGSLSEGVQLRFAVIKAVEG